MHTGGNDAKLKTRLSKSSPFELKMLVEFILRGISVLPKSFPTEQGNFPVILGKIAASVMSRKPHRKILFTFSTSRLYGHDVFQKGGDGI